MRNPLAIRSLRAPAQQSLRLANIRPGRVTYIIPIHHLTHYPNQSVQTEP